MDKLQKLIIKLNFKIQFQNISNGLWWQHKNKNKHAQKHMTQLIEEGHTHARFFYTEKNVIKQSNE